MQKEQKTITADHRHFLEGNERYKQEIKFKGLYFAVHEDKMVIFSELDNKLVVVDIPVEKVTTV